MAPHVRFRLTIAAPTVPAASAAARKIVAATAGASIISVACLRSRSAVLTECLSAPLDESAAVDAAPLCGSNPRSIYGFLRLLFRALQLAFLMVPPLVLLVPVLAFPHDDNDGPGEEAHSWRSRFNRALLSALERAGPCTTKLGQWASTRPDILPLSLCQTLSSLHHRVSAHSLEQTKAAIHDSFGVPPDVLFRSLSPLPVGSGCIAQVHEAVAADGSRLAIKVLHPHVEARVADDLLLLRLSAAAMQALLRPVVRGLRWLAITEALDEFSTFMGSQLDLRREAEHLDTFRSNFAHEPRIVVPRPVREPLVLAAREADAVAVAGTEGSAQATRQLMLAGGLVSRRVLAETFVEGQTVSAMLIDDQLAAEAAAEADEAASAAMAAAGMGASDTADADASAAVAVAAQHEAAARLRAERNADLARLGLRTFLTMLLKHNFVHADLHPGNMLVTGNTGRIRGDEARGGEARGGEARGGEAPLPGDGEGTARGDRGDRGEEVRVPGLALLDAGLVVRLSPRDQRNFLALFRAIGDGDGARAGELMLTHAREQRCADPAAFKEGMRQLVAKAGAGQRGLFNLGHVKIGEVLLEVTSLVRTHQVQADPTFTTLVCSIVVLEGLGRQLDPSLDLFSVALPLLAGVG